MAPLVEAEVVQLQRDWSRSAMAPEDDADASEQLGHGEGSGDVVVGVHIERLQTVVLVVRCGEEDDWHVLLAQLPSDHEAVRPVRELRVEEGKMRRHSTRFLQSGQPVGAEGD